MTFARPSYRAFRKVQRFAVIGGLTLVAAVAVPGLPAQRCFGQDLGITQDVDPQTVLGSETCKECHQAEFAAWEKSSHATDSFAYLSKPDAGKIADKLGIASPLKEAACLTCHATQHAGGAFQHVSCESCHNGAGEKSGQVGWLKIHSYYGKDLDPKDKGSRGQESEQNYQRRSELCEAAGMRRSENVYKLAKNCLECHIVGSEKLVNDGGHPTQSKGFEFFEWAQGEVRHNYQVDQSKNAEAPTVWTTARFQPGRTVEGHQQLMYVVGQLADLEVNLRNRSKATGRGDFADNANDRIEDCVKELEKITKSHEIPEIKNVLSSVSKVEKSLKDYTGNDAATYGALADQVQAAGEAVATSYNGNDWGSVKLPRRTKGDAQP